MEFPTARGDKIWKPSVVGYGYFLELPIIAFFWYICDPSREKEAYGFRCQ